MHRSFFLLLSVVLTVSLTKAYFHSGFPYTHDGENHLARFVSYKLALRQGQFPPRFAPNLLNNYGYPVFSYQYPLANILAQPLLLVKVHPELAFKILVMGFVLFGCGGIWKLSQEFQLEKKAQLVSLAVYMASPLLFSAIVYRGNIGEVMAYTLLPWVLWSVRKIAKAQYFPGIFLLTAFALSHNLSVLFSLPIVGAFVLCFTPFTRQTWKRLVVAAGSVFTLTAWFWIPAVLEKQLVNIEQVDLAKGYADHFITLAQLFPGVLQFGFSSPGPVDSLGFSIGLLFWIMTGSVLVITAQRVFTRSVSASEKSQLAVLSLILGSYVFAQTSLSAVFWQLVPVLQIIQFPWRLSLFLPTLVVMVFLKLDWQPRKAITLVIIALACAQMMVFWRLRPVDYFHRNYEDYAAFSGTTSTQHENTARTFTYTDTSQWQPGPSLEGKGEVKVEYWSGSQRRYTVAAEKEVMVIEPTMNFAGWQTRIRSADNQDWIPLEYIFDERTQGRIGFQLPAGIYQVESRFTQRTPARLVGNSLSIIGILGCMLYLGRRIQLRHGS